MLTNGGDTNRLAINTRRSTRLSAHELPRSTKPYSQAVPGRLIGIVLIVVVGLVVVTAVGGYLYLQHYSPYAPYLAGTRALAFCTAPRGDAREPSGVPTADSPGLLPVSFSRLTTCR